MRNTKKICTIVLMIILSVSTIMAIGISSVSASPAHPEIVVRPLLQQGVSPGVTANYEFNIKNAPHVDNETAQAEQHAGTGFDTYSKTWAWQVELEWDPTVLALPSASLISEDPTYSFLGWWQYYEFVDLGGFGWFEGPYDYPRSGLTIDLSQASSGKAIIADGMLESCPPNYPLADPYFIETNPDPNVGLHLGSNYDLPFTEGLSVMTGKPNELNLFRVRFSKLKNGPPYATPITVKATVNTFFFAHDARTEYHVSLPRAWFGSEGPYLESTEGIIDPSSPVGTTWHELYPTYSTSYTALEWEDNDNSVLDYCDYLWMDNGSSAMWYHVEAVTQTLILDSKPPTGEQMRIDYDCCQDEIPPYDPVPWPDAMNTQWHEIYPVFCNRYQIVDFADEGDGYLGPSDQIWLEDKDTGVVTEWHIFDVATDIIVTPQPDKPPPGPEFPLGIGLLMMMALAIPTVYVWKLRKKVPKQ